MQEIWRDPVLINTVGHTAGALLFGMIIVLLLRNWRASGLNRTKLPLIAAILALGWNVGSLVVLALPAAGSGWSTAITTASFSMLTLLPAVLLQVAVQGRQRFIVAAGYVVSVISTALHSAELFVRDGGLHQAALLVVAFGFGGLAVTSFLLSWRRHIGRDLSQSISLACLLLFTSSFLHFGYQHTNSPWSAEITWHHIGIPVALIVLLRDYRFLLLDTFLRFFVNFGLSVVYVAGVLALGFEWHLWDLIHSSKFLIGISLVGACFSLILFAHLRNALQAWMNRAVFRRQSVQGCVAAIAAAGAKAHTEEELLLGASRAIADYLRTDHFAVTEPKVEPAAPSAASLLAGTKLRGVNAERFRPEAQIPLRLSSGDVRYLLVGSRRGGQRYWSDELNDMRQLGTAVVEQVERFRAEELKQLVRGAELRALQAQINPHFLFNALNTLYGIIDRGSRDARRTVLNLADIFRYFLQGHRTFIPLSEEMRIVEAYLDIETLRLGDRLTTELIVSEAARSSTIPILSVQPLVENAVKHGIAPNAGPSRLTVRAELLAEGVRVSVEDDGIGFVKSRARSHEGTGLGLENVRRRLALSYGSAANLEIDSSDAGSKVGFLVPCSFAAGVPSTEAAAIRV